MNIIEQLKWRYATKSFDENAILTEDKIHTLTQAFNLTATSYGLQPIKLIVIQNKALQHELMQHAMNQKQIEQASHLFIFCIQTTIDKHFVNEYFNRVHTIRKTPKEILQPFEDFLINDFENKSQKDIDIWATNQAYLAMGNLMTVCAMEDIDACPMEGFLPHKIDEALNLREKGLKSVLLMPVGYRAQDDKFAAFKKVRKNIEDAVIKW
ncbi:NAD(P)H-dependent oxidoreductase [Mangrovimonas spongiae]|uniref:NAD(P)H-dependent oxidoreductase n=1 Tax=Mangrovimonas spongiae TaxID=2494697 RepID=A0A428K1N3_9FLAO|nr:NAD(P)H-dependent oxidoreductase [Mangrovimonas spongiae]RSK40263.1 NAD(P)H-dependent oxidoreductase [Mangrovimonas spongiae]